MLDRWTCEKDRLLLVPGERNLGTLLTGHPANRDHYDSWVRSDTCSTDGCGREYRVQQTQQEHRDLQRHRGANS